MDWHFYNPKFEYQDQFTDIDPFSAWVGHVYFAYDLVRNTNPKTIVELGTHKGTSFFSMCQAIKDSSSSANLVAIDTWQGDKHAGHYDISIFNEVQDVVKNIYAKQNIKLIKKYFDEALPEFKTNSIDILHIDGLHTYEAVKHDFDGWISKVSTNGIILLHDICEKNDGFGVYKLWDELKEKYDNLEFSHSHGLGIIFKNKQPHFRLDLNNIWQRYYELEFNYNLIADENEILHQKIINLDVKLSTTVAEINRLQNDLSKIQSSKTYILWQKFNQLKKFLKK